MSIVSIEEFGCSFVDATAVALSSSLSGKPAFIKGRYVCVRVYTCVSGWMSGARYWQMLAIAICCMNSKSTLNTHSCLSHNLLHVPPNDFLPHQLLRTLPIGD